MRNSSEAYEIKLKFLLPERIVLAENCENAAKLLDEAPRQAILGDYQTAVIKAGGFVLLDFGIELQGGVDITVKNAAKGTMLRIVFGESVSEAMSSIGEKNAVNDHAIRDMQVEVTSWQHFRTSNTGFRFAKLAAVNGDILLAGVQAAFEYRDIAYKGSFVCDDELLCRIWKTGAYTVHLNMQEYIWDGIKRDRLVWIGDMHPEVSTVACVFGAEQSVPKSLDLIKNATPPDKWMNGIPSYTMWWVKIQRDWYFYTGDTAYLKEQKEYLYEALRHIISCVKPNGENTIERKFVDWSSNETKWSEAGLHSMMMISLAAGAKLCGILGNRILLGECRKALGYLKKRVPEYSGNKQIAALVALAGLAPYEKISGEVLKPGGARGLSTFMGYYTLQALARAGDMDAAIGIIKEYWGGMLALGATTFWEYFDIDEAKNASPITEPPSGGKADIHGDFGSFCYKQLRNSLCHGWASGPTAFLSEYVLGVKIIEPGFKKIKIEPQLGNLKWVKGTYPTPYGTIEIEHRSVNGKIMTAVNAPREVEIIKCEK